MTRCSRWMTRGLFRRTSPGKPRSSPVWTKNRYTKTGFFSSSPFHPTLPSTGKVSPGILTYSYSTEDRLFSGYFLEEGEGRHCLKFINLVRLGSILHNTHKPESCGISWVSQPRLRTSSPWTKIRCVPEPVKQPPVPLLAAVFTRNEVWIFLTPN